MAAGILVKDLNAWFGTLHVLRDIGLAIAPKAVTAIIGPSGCGKSTFIRCLNRMHEVVPSARVSGTVLVEGADLYAPGVDPVEVRRKIGMVFQRANPFPTMSAFDNVAAGLRLGGIRNRAELNLELRKDLTIVIVTHNMQQAARVSEATGFFLLGELVEFGVTRELFTNPRDKRTEDYITGRFG